MKELLKIILISAIGAGVVWYFGIDKADFLSMYQSTVNAIGNIGN